MRPTVEPRAASIAIALAAIACGACAERETATAPAPAPAPAARAAVEEGLEGALSLVAGPGLIERGAADAGDDWVTVFERETGCRVALEVVAATDDRVAVLARGGVDLVVAPSAAARRLVRERAVQPLDLERLPSHANVDERLARAPWLHAGGAHYGVPLTWGVHVLLHSTEAFRTPPRSWAVVFEPQRLPDGRGNRGRVLAPDDATVVADAALYLRAKRPELGIVDPFALDERQYSAVLELLRTQHPLVRGYAAEASAYAQAFTQDGVVAARAPAAVVERLRASGLAVAGTVPAEGATGWADALLLATGAPHPNCAYRFLEWSLNAQVQGELAARNGAVPAVPAACRLHARLGEDGCTRHGADRFDDVAFAGAADPPTCAEGGCVPASRWAPDLAEIRAGR